jgi:hypothetical protein
MTIPYGRLALISWLALVSGPIAADDPYVEAFEGTYDAEGE